LILIVSCGWQDGRFEGGIMGRFRFGMDYHCSTIDTQGK
jgi:hypothetical protein